MITIKEFLKFMELVEDINCNDLVCVMVMEKRVFVKNMSTIRALQEKLHKSDRELEEALLNMEDADLMEFINNFTYWNIMTISQNQIYFYVNQPISKFSDEHLAVRSVNFLMKRVVLVAEKPINLE